MAGEICRCLENMSVEGIIVMARPKRMEPVKVSYEQIR